MKNFLRKKSLREKIVFVVMATTVISLLFVSTIFLINELITYRYTLATELSRLGKLVGMNAKTAIIANDKKAAREMLSLLSHEPNIVLSRIYTEDGTIFASFPDDYDRSLGFLAEGLYLERNHIHSYEGIYNKGVKIGVIHLEGNLIKLYDRLFLFGKILLVLMLCTFLVALQVSTRLQRVITDPIHQLIKVSKLVIKNKDYSFRAKRESEDEVGDLVDTFNEMLDTIDKAQKKLTHRTLHDDLTGLPNRILLNDRIDRLIQYSRRNPDYQFAVLFLDFDRFKVVNDSLGHLKGDELLKQISDRLTHLLRDVDTVARIGGDEYVVLLNHIKHTQDTIRVAERIQNALKSYFILDNQKVYVTTSIGIAINKKEYSRAVEILRDADNAMYRAKSLGKANYQIFDENMHLQSMNVLKLEMDLRSAVDKNEFAAYYQPIFSLKDQKVVRLEALMRWEHPRRGLIFPGGFIPLAEETGLILPIGKILINTVFHQFSTWQKKGVELVDVAINVSVRQFEQEGFVKYIKEKISETGINPEKLTIEITESVAMNNLAHSIELLNELKNMGIKISIDDFGTGFSSLSCLRSFPVDHVKIDHSFIRSIGTSKEDEAVVRAIITMSHDLRFTVVAEGVETKSQLDVLNQCGCDEVQGFLISKVLPTQEIEKKELYKISKRKISPDAITN